MRKTLAVNQTGWRIPVVFSEDSDWTRRARDLIAGKIIYTPEIKI